MRHKPAILRKKEKQNTTATLKKSVFVSTAVLKEMSRHTQPTPQWD